MDSNFKEQENLLASFEASESNEEEIKNDIQFLMVKPPSRQSMINPKENYSLNCNVERTSRNTVSANLFSRKSEGTDSHKDMIDSLIVKSSSKADWAKKSYKSPGNFRNIVYETPRINESSMILPDIEKNQQADEVDDTSNIYLYDQLVNEMGFNAHMVKNILKYDKDFIQDNLLKCFDLLIKTERGWLHTFVTETDNNPAELSWELYRASIGETRDKCVVCGEPRIEHQKATYVKPFVSQTNQESKAYVTKNEEEKSSAVRTSSLSNGIKPVEKTPDIDSEESDDDPHDIKALCEM
jgi:hypothetical protein